MDRRVLALGLAALGLVLAIVSGLADVIGISFGAAADEDFGWIQIAGLVLGVVIAVAGLVFAMTARGRTSGSRSAPDRAAE
jgi:hypothetical protein